MSADPRHTTVTTSERDVDLADGGPEEAYLMDDGSGGYVLGAGDKANEATAFLKDDGSGGFILDDDAAEEDRKIYKTSDGVII